MHLIFQKYLYAFDLSENAMLATDYGDGTRYLVNGSEKWKIISQEHFNNYGFDHNKMTFGKKVI
jgi:hypothetical protein